jgi:hypothetical protein
VADVDWFAEFQESPERREFTFEAARFIPVK